VNLSSADSSGIESMLSRWREKSSGVEVDYSLLQSILIQRCTLAHLCTDVLSSAAVKPQLHSVFEDWAAAARKAGRFQVCCLFLTSSSHHHHQQQQQQSKECKKTSINTNRKSTMRFSMSVRPINHSFIDLYSA